MPLSCKDIVSQSTDLIDKDSKWANRLAIRFHLLMCHHCRRFIRHKKIANEYFFKQQQLNQFSDAELDNKIDCIMQQVKASQAE